MRTIAVAMAISLASPLAAQEAPSGQVLQPGAAAMVPAPIPGAPLSPSYAAAVGRMAYI